jgi:hypothetical protein
VCTYRLQYLCVFVIHAKELIDRLETLATIEFSGDVFRATRRGLDALTASTRGGRWSPREELGSTESIATLYTSCTREGALAELAFHYGQLTPFPSKSVMLHRLTVVTQKTLRLIQVDLIRLGVVWDQYATLNYETTRRIGAAVAFLGCDGLIAPSARWKCENLMLFPTNHGFRCELSVTSSDEVDLRQWALDNQLYREGD